MLATAEPPEEGRPWLEDEVLTLFHFAEAICHEASLRYEDSKGSGRSKAKILMQTNRLFESF